MMSQYGLRRPNLNEIKMRHRYDVACRVGIVFFFVNNDQHKILDLMIYNMLGFWNSDFWSYGCLVQVSFLLFGVCRSYMCTSSCKRQYFQMTQFNSKSEKLEIVPTLLKNKKNQRVHFLHCLTFSLFTEFITYFNK